MRLAFVHGINNESETTASIEQAWWEALVRGWDAAGLPLKQRPNITAAYYADLLTGSTKSNAVEMGASAVSTGLAVGLLQEYAEAANVTDAELASAAADMELPVEAVEQGVPHEGWIVSFASALERALPTKGKVLARLFLRQAATYINDKALAARIDNKVASSIFGGKPDPVIVVAHSLGTVVSYRILSDPKFQGRDAPLFVTLGSPLSLRMFKGILVARGSIPAPPIGAWHNFRHKDDFVTLGRAITLQSIGFEGVEDSTDVADGDPDRHSIAQYLSSPAVAKLIHAHL